MIKSHDDIVECVYLANNQTFLCFGCSNSEMSHDKYAF